MKKPLVSIIVPTYSRPKYLKRAIDSCLNQTYKNIEVIIIDDNNITSDEQIETENIINELYSKEKRVKYLKMPQNSGACLARNLGIEHSKGEYITFLDDDDEFYPNNIEEELNYLTKNNYDMIFCDLEFVNDITNESYKRKYIINFEINHENLLRRQLLSGFSGGIGYFYKASVLKELGGWTNSPASQDYILLLRTIGEGYNVGYFDFIGAKAHYVSSNTKITGSKKALQGKIIAKKYKDKYSKILTFQEKRLINYGHSTVMYRGLRKFKDLKFIYWGLKKLMYLDIHFKKKKKGVEKDEEKGFICIK